jgi:hypothetical protein
LSASSSSRGIVVFERLGGLDERDQLLFKDIVRSNVLTASSGLLPGCPATMKLAGRRQTRWPVG